MEFRTAVTARLTGIRAAEAASGRESDGSEGRRSRFITPTPGERSLTATAWLAPQPAIPGTGFFSELRMLSSRADAVRLEPGCKIFDV